MKTTIDLPDPIFRRAKATAAVRGITLKSFISKAVEQSLDADQKDWRAVLKDLPHVDQETTDEIMRSVAESDEIDLEFQRRQLEAMQ
jgi:Fe-S cluster assembly ATPase SufC